MRTKDIQPVAPDAQDDTKTDRDSDRDRSAERKTMGIKHP